jgi:hypothetical protein
MTAKRNSRESGATNTLPSIPADAHSQVTLIAGADDAPIVIRAIHWDRSETGKALHRAKELRGSIQEIGSEAARLNASGYNIYMVAQLVDCPRGPFTTDADVSEIRCIYADGDESEQPTRWHVEPTFTLTHPVTGRWWAFWTVRHFPKEELRDFIKRIAERYGSDAKISNLARIVRVAGYDRWKDGSNDGPYELRKLSGGVTEPWMHEDLPRVEPRKGTVRMSSKADVIDVARLHALLALIEPFDRENWLKVMFAIRDGVVIDGNGTELDEADKLSVVDDWASGDLHDKATGAKLKDCHVGNYQGYEDNALNWDTPRSKTDSPATFGTLVHLDNARARLQKEARI